MNAPVPLGESFRSASDRSGLRVTLRPARADDQEAIVELVRAERLNPNDLHWERFVVATVGDAIAGAVQMRHHGDGSLELSSLVVRPDQRGQELGDHLIAQLLASYPCAVVHVITRQRLAHRFERWGFQVIGRRGAPSAIRRNHGLGQVLGGLAALCQGRLPTRLMILRRA